MYLESGNIDDVTNEPLAEQPAAPILGAYSISIKTFLIFMKTVDFREPTEVPRTSLGLELVREAGSFGFEISF